MKTVKKNEYIHEAGTHIDSVGVILTGSVLMTQTDIWGNRNIITKFSAGDSFGDPYTTKKETVLNVDFVAAENSQIVFLKVDKVLNTCTTRCEHHQTLIKNFVISISRKALAFNEKTIIMGKRTTKEKLMAYLSAESLKQGSKEFDIPYNRQQLADYLCVERSAMSVEISKLQQEGVLKTNRNHFKLLM